MITYGVVPQGAQPQGNFQGDSNSVIPSLSQYPMMHPVMTQIPNLLPRPFAQMLPSMPLFMPGMDPQMQYYMMIPIMVKWRFMGQPRPMPLGLPSTASVLDLYVSVFNTLHREGLVRTTDRLNLSVTSPGQVLQIDEQVHSPMPVVATGLGEPSAVLDVSIKASS